tara:strand:+ start:276 stop:560 length:285 start_codon:yes stop_codon:yes gene_type:complete
MPGITKKKTKKKTTSKGMRGSEVSPGERKKKLTGPLKALGWVVATLEKDPVVKFLKSPARGVARTKSGKGSDAGTSKGMRGSEKKTTKKSRGRK